VFTPLLIDSLFPGWPKYCILPDALSAYSARLRILAFSFYAPFYKYLKPITRIPDTRIITHRLANECNNLKKYLPSISLAQSQGSPEESIRLTAIFIERNFERLLFNLYPIIPGYFNIALQIGTQYQL